jgi:hypothetical protein
VIVDDVIVEDGPDKGVDFPEEEDRTGLCWPFAKTLSDEGGLMNS